MWTLIIVRAAVVGPEMTMLRVTNDANVITAVHKAIVGLVQDNRKTDLRCQRASHVASASVRLSYIRCTLITLTQFLTLRSATETRLDKSVTHKRPVNTYGQLWLRRLTCSCHIIFENLFSCKTAWNRMKMRYIILISSQSNIMMHLHVFKKLWILVLNVLHRAMRTFRVSKILV